MSLPKTDLELHLELQEDEPKDPDGAKRLPTRKRKRSGCMTSLGGAANLMLLKQDKELEKALSKPAASQIHVHQDADGNIVDIQLYSKSVKLGKALRAGSDESKDILEHAMARPRDLKHAGPWTVINLDPRAKGDDQMRLMMGLPGPKKMGGASGGQ